MKNLTEQLAKVEIAQQKKEELETEMKTKVAEVRRKDIRCKIKKKPHPNNARMFFWFL